jgi:hypothetical protein
LFHLVAPFCANLFAALFIIFTIARRQASIRVRQSYKRQLCQQFDNHKQLIISPIVLVLLSLLYFIISILSGCVKTSRNPWLYLSSYFISFIPSTCGFIIFVLPSTFYRQQFNASIRKWRRRIHN